MTTKDYIALSAAVRLAKCEIWKADDQTPENVLATVVNRLAIALAQDNPRFSREAFLAACEL